MFGVERSLAMLDEELEAASAALAPLSKDASMVLRIARDAVAPALRSPAASAGSALKGA